MRKYLSLALLLFTLAFLILCRESRDYRQDMRDFVQDISSYAKALVSDFLIIPQNGGELLTEDGEQNGLPSEEYLAALDGVGREDLYYGYDNNNQPTPAGETVYMEAFLDVAESYDIEGLVTNYCWTQAYMDDSYRRSEIKGYISFAADFRELHNIPAYPPNPNNVNPENIVSLHETKNFLFLLNPVLYPDKISYINALQAADYDLLIIDLFYEGDEILTPGDVEALKTKNNGGKRLVLAYMSIGEAEEYRYYWNDGWLSNPPSWLGKENPDWEGNYKVRFWERGWQDIIFGATNSYLKKIIDAGFDGVYLDIIDAFEYWEENGKSVSSLLWRYFNRSP